MSRLCGGDPLARQLAVLQPLPPGLNRDQLLYAAGSAARDRDVAFWKRLFAGQCAVVCGLVGVGVAVAPMRNAEFGMRNDDTVVRQQPAVPAGPPPTTTPPREESPADIPRSEFRIPNSQGFAGADPDESEPGERAKWLRLRADVFAAGLGVLPTPAAPPPRADATALERSLQLPPGVLAAPYAPPKPKPKPEVDEKD